MAEGEIESPEREQDLEVVRTALGAFGRAVTNGEIEAFLELLDEEVDLEIPSAIRREVVKLRGLEETRRYLEQIASDYVELRVDPREFRRLDGDRLLVVGRWQGRASGGTTPFGTPLALIVELREGRVASLRGFMDEQQALEATGAR
jgi:ketosteroid isomerase-like protein